MSGRFLRTLNLILAPMQIVASIAAFGLRTTFDEATASPAGDPPIIPAGYAFVIWSVIFSGSVFYGIYQYARSRHDDPLLMQIRPFTASAFAATVCWLAAARFNLTGLTVICILWLLGSLLPVFLAFTRSPRVFSKLDQVAMVIPFSIYTGWVTVATFANASAFLHQHGLLNVVLTPAWWAVIMLTAAGVIAARLTFRSGNFPFALTVCWALIAILVANLTREYHAEVVITCALMTAAQIGALVLSRRRPVVT